LGPVLSAAVQGGIPAGNMNVIHAGHGGVTTFGTAGGSGGAVSSASGGGGAGKPIKQPIKPVPVLVTSGVGQSFIAEFHGTKIPQKLLMTGSDYSDLMKCQRISTNDLMDLPNFQDFLSVFTDAYDLFAEYDLSATTVDNKYSTIFIFSKDEYTKIRVSTLEFAPRDISKWVMDRNHEQKLRPNDSHPNPFA
jgi:hypothetical protein